MRKLESRRPSSRIGKAFTLIELIVVIVIIGILASVGAVAYNSIIENATLSSKEASADQVAKLYQAQVAFDQVAFGEIMWDMDGVDRWGNTPTVLGDVSLCDSPRPVLVGDDQEDWDFICPSYRPAGAADIAGVGNGIMDTASWVPLAPEYADWITPFSNAAEGDRILAVSFDNGDIYCVVSFGQPTGPANVAPNFYSTPVGRAAEPAQCARG